MVQPAIILDEELTRDERDRLPHRFRVDVGAEPRLKGWAPAHGLSLEMTTTLEHFQELYPEEDPRRRVISSAESDGWETTLTPWDIMGRGTAQETAAMHLAGREAGLLAGEAGEDYPGRLREAEELDFATIAALLELESYCPGDTANLGWSDVEELLNRHLTELDDLVIR